MNAKILTPDYSNITRGVPALYQMAPCGPSQMMGYVLRTRSGRIYCVDGGTSDETEAFLRLCRSACGAKDGEKLHISGWFLTHPHYDHVSVLRDTVLQHSDDVEIGTLYMNFFSNAHHEKYEPRFAETTREFEEMASLLEPFRHIVHEGESFDFGDVRFDILHEPDESIHEDITNNSSVVIRTVTEGQTILFLGDLGQKSGAGMLEKYGRSLKADYVEMAHHGQGGVRMDVYAAISPRVCLWCTPQWLWNNDGGKGYGTGPFETFLTRCFMADLGVEHNFVQKDGIWEILL